jgi:hypothetical protein
MSKLAGQFFTLCWSNPRLRQPSGNRCQYAIKLTSSTTRIGIQEKEHTAKLFLTRG